MIIKSADDKEASIRTLEAILKIPGLPANKRALVDQEIRTTKSGIKGESDAAYLIDSHFNDSDNTMVLHDLRLELADGRVAQIDHLLIHRTGRMWVLESKRVAHGIKITDDGEFLRWNGRQYDGMASPLEQNKRHVEVVKALIRSLDGRFEIKQYLAYVLLSSKARIDRPKKFDASLVVKADLFISAYERDLEKIGLFSLLGAIFTGEHVALARELARQHKPIEFDYGSRFGVSADAIERMLNPASPQVFQPLANDMRVPRSAPSASSPATARLPATSPGAVASGPGIGPTAAERPQPPLEQATVTTGEWDYDPDWLDHLGLIGQTVGAKLPTLADGDEELAIRDHAPAGEELPPPLQQPVSPHAPVANPTTDAEHRCRHCDSTNVQVAHGQYGYYFKCRTCAGNTPIKISCAQPGHRERIRKDGPKFFRECAACATSTVFFQNVSPYP